MLQAKNILHQLLRRKAIPSLTDALEVIERAEELPASDRIVYLQDYAARKGISLATLEHIRDAWRSS